MFKERGESVLLDLSFLRHGVSPLKDRHLYIEFGGMYA